MYSRIESSSAHSRGGPITFSLDEKVTKNQAAKILPPTGKTPRPAFCGRPLPAFMRGEVNAYILISVFYQYSVRRTASGEIRQNDAGLCGCRASQIFAEARAQCVSEAGATVCRPGFP